MMLTSTKVHCGLCAHNSNYNPTSSPVIQEASECKRNKHAFQISTPPFSWSPELTPNPGVTQVLQVLCDIQSLMFCLLATWFFSITGIMFCLKKKTPVFLRIISFVQSIYLLVRTPGIKIDSRGVRQCPGFPSGGSRWGSFSEPSHFVYISRH